MASAPSPRLWAPPSGASVAEAGGLDYSCEHGGCAHAAGAAEPRTTPFLLARRPVGAPADADHPVRAAGRPHLVAADPRLLRGAVAARSGARRRARVPCAGGHAGPQGLRTAQG